MSAVAGGWGRYAPGARAAAPLALAVAVFGIAFGVAARSVGMGTLAPLVMSATTFAGSAQFAVTSVLAGGGSVVTALAAGVLLNLRYLPIGISVAPALAGSVGRRLLVAQLAVDEAWAISTVGSGRVDRERLIGAGAVIFVAWLGGTAIGTFAAEGLRDPRVLGLDAMFPALFAALLVGQLGSTPARRAALLGGLISLVSIPLLPVGLPVVAASLAALIGLRERHD